jgi:hypothetical protein
MRTAEAALAVVRRLSAAARKETERCRSLARISLHARLSCLRLREAVIDKKSSQGLCSGGLISAGDLFLLKVLPSVRYIAVELRRSNHGQSCLPIMAHAIFGKIRYMSFTNTSKNGTGAKKDNARFP